MFGNVGEALEKGVGFRHSAWPILIRVAWVLFVTYNLARALGWLAYLGFASPFAKASDVEKLLRAAEVNARISMQQEIRVQTRVWCSNADADVREFAYRRIEELRRDLHEIAKVPTPEPNCAPAVVPSQ